MKGKRPASVPSFCFWEVAFFDFTSGLFRPVPLAAVTEKRYQSSEVLIIRYEGPA